MRAILMGAVLAIAASVPALAGDEVLASRFGNTTITKANGVENHVYYAADHTFSAKQGAITTKGTWKIDGGTICLSFETPVPGTPNPACAPVSDHKVGDTWTAGPYTVSLVAGIQ